MPEPVADSVQAEARICRLRSEGVPQSVGCGPFGASLLAKNTMTLRCRTAMFIFPFGTLL